MQIVEEVPLAQLKPFPGNARAHSRKQIRQLARAIKRYSFTAPVLIDENGMILAGHARVEAARLLGRETVPCLRLSHMSAADKRAYVLADNQLATKAGWDRDALAVELKALIDIGFDMDLVGFEPAEIDFALAAHEAAKGVDDSKDDYLPALRAQTVTERGMM